MEMEKESKLENAILSEGVNILILKGEKNINEIDHIFNESLATIICSKHETGLLY